MSARARSVPFCCCSLALDNESLLSVLCAVGEGVCESWNRDLEYKLPDLFGNGACAGLRVGLLRSGSPSWLICECGGDLADSEGG